MTVEIRPAGAVVVDIVESDDKSQIFPVSLTTTVEINKVTDGDFGPVDGGSTPTYTHNQTSPATSWTVNHNFGYRPSGISVISVGGQVVNADITHTSVNQFIVSFSMPYSGMVRVI